jgi:hypothetical protein
MDTPVVIDLATDPKRFEGGSGPTPSQALVERGTPLIRDL